MTKYCMHCGALVNPEDRFCANCGKEIERKKTKQSNSKSSSKHPKRECVTCGIVSDEKKFFELSAKTGPNYICKDCAAELGINNFMSAGFYSNTQVLKKYVKIHPEAQFRLEQQLVRLEEYKAEVRDELKAWLNKQDTSIVKKENISIDKLSDEELIRRMDNYLVKNPGMMLGVGEKCFYQGTCYSVRLKNVVTGTSGNSIHIGGKNALGMYMGSGTSQRRYDRSTVAEKYPGKFYITNYRMICSSPKLAFEIELTNITSLTAYVDALIITAKDKSYIVETADIEIIKEFLAVNNEGVKRGLTGNIKDADVNAGKKGNDSQKNGEEKIIQFLREYKNLYDEGIITEEEFLNKKKELLRR